MDIFLYLSANNIFNIYLADKYKNMSIHFYANKSNHTSALITLTSDLKAYHTSSL